MFKKLLILPVLLITLSAYSQEKQMYLFSTFREPATDGLYLASSSDGYHWDDLGGPYLKPEIGQQKVMRDPSVVQGPSGSTKPYFTMTSRASGDCMKS